jgi:hypothetical protein
VRKAIKTIGAAAVLAPIASEFRVKRAARPITDRWRDVEVEPRGTTALGVSFRPRQVEDLGLDGPRTFEMLLSYPIDVVRLGAYWDRIEREPGACDHSELDWQVDAAEQAGKNVIICVGAVKTFGYPEFFVPSHHLPVPLPEGALVEPSTHPDLLAAAQAEVARVADRYRNRASVIAWQVEHEAVDPLGIEHSWRLSTSFVQAEVDAVRDADATRPIMMNGFLPTSVAVRAQQWWRTRDQGDSLSVARNLADMVGIDFYPRHALVGTGRWSAYLDGSRKPWQQRTRRQLFDWAGAHAERSLLVAEGQGEPWEAVTTPPNPDGRAMYSCLPEHLIDNYNQCLRWCHQVPAGSTRDDGGTHREPSHQQGLQAYLFWGAEYWVLRQHHNDASYLDAFARVLNESAPGAPR